MLTSGSHLSDAAVRARPAWQRAIAAWLPCTVVRPRIKCAIGTTRRRPDSAATFRSAPFRLRRCRCPNRLASPRPDRAVAIVQSRATAVSESRRCPAVLRRREFHPRWASPEPSSRCFSSVECRAHLPLHPHRRRTTVGHHSQISSPHRRRGAPMSYLPLPHARRVASPSWVLDRRRLHRLHRCSIATDHAATRARERWMLLRAPRCAAPSWAAQAEASPASAGRSLRTWAARAMRVGRAGTVSVGHACTVHLGRALFRPSGSQFKFSIFWIYSIPCKFKNLCRIHLNSEKYETNFVVKVLICTRF
jgi:hypothetical protein